MREDLREKWRQFQKSKWYKPVISVIIIFSVIPWAFLIFLTNKPQQAQKSIFAMDTYMTLSCMGKDADSALDEACEEIKRLDALLCAANENSEVARLNSAGGGAVSSDIARLLNASLNLYADTNGAFDAALLPLTSAWGFSTGEYRVPTRAELENSLSLSGSENITFNGKTLAMEQGSGLDLGGIAKGYAGDRVRDILKARGISSACISLGGNVCVIGSREDSKPWRVGIQDPQGGYLGILSVEDMSVVTSGSYERYFTDNSGRTYHHILDPETGYPADSGLVSVTIVCESGTLADGLSTACFVMGAQKALEYRRERGDFELVMLCEDGTLYATQGLKDSFESQREVIWED